MQYLQQHYDTFYFRRKLQYQTICISLKTKNILEAKYILSIINSKLEVMREVMDIVEEVEYIKNILKKYVEVAKEEYSDFANRREQKYTYTKENGKKLLGSHPKAIDYHIEELQDSVYSVDKEEIAQDIINDSNITEEYTQAIKELSEQSRQRLLDEVIKAEIEILHYDKSRNETRTNPERMANTYIDNDIYNPNNTYHNQNIAHSTISTLKETIMEAKEQEEAIWREKTKEEVFKEYLKEVKEDKANMLDKVIQPIKTLLQVSEEKYLVDYKKADYEILFDSLIYTPKYVYTNGKLYKDYKGNYVQIAEDFKESLSGEENLLSNYIPDEKVRDRIQSETTVEEKLNETLNFLDYCEKEQYIKNNYLRGNKKFSTKKFQGILKGTRKRKPFNDTELNLMFTKLNEYVNQNGFRAEEILIPLVGLYSGMRVEEICKLRVEDIIQDSKTDIWYFDINGLVKTESSVRQVPIHSQLIDKFNFLHYVELQKKKQADMLFDLKSVYHKGKQKFSHYFLRDFFYDFRDSFVSEERIEENLIAFHSFRHTFATRLRAGRVDFYSISNLLGHTVDTVLENVFEIKLKANETPTYVEEELKILKENIEKLQLSDIQNSIDNFSITYNRFFSIATK